MPKMKTLEDYGRMLEPHLRIDVQPGAHNERLIEACNYSLQAGGKRIRPALLLACADYAGADLSRAIPFAVGLEMIHTYSLIHDDLPAMDNDVLRRGKPTNHVVYGEAMAILAGDALLSQGLLCLMNGAMAIGSRGALDAMRHIAAAAGIHGMVGGQAADILWEQKPDAGPAEKQAALEYIQLNKTSALIECAVLAGVCLGSLDEVGQRDFALYARCLGVMFQIADDILDCVSSPEEMGKTTHKDETVGKLTATSLHGLDGAREMLNQLAVQAKEALAGHPNTEFFLQTVDTLKNRTH